MHNRAIKSLWPRPGCIRTKVEAHMGEFRRAKRTMSLRPRAKCKEKARIFWAFLLSSNGSSGVRDSSLDRSIHNPRSAVPSNRGGTHNRKPRGLQPRAHPLPGQDRIHGNRGPPAAMPVRARRRLFAPAAAKRSANWDAHHAAAPPR